MLVAPELHGGISRGVGQAAGREGHLGVEAKRRERDLGEALRREPGVADDDLLDVRMRRTGPCWSKWCHCACVWAVRRAETGIM